MYNKDEPRQEAGTGHVVTLDGETTKSQVWMQTDRHQVNAPNAVDEVINAVSWIAFSSLLVHLIRLLSPLVMPLALLLTALLGCFGIYSLINEKPQTFYSYLTLFFLSLLLVTL